MRKKSVFSLSIAIIAICILLTACSEATEVDNTSVIKVEEAISNIGEVALNSESLILEAEELYNGLSDEDKESVENYNELEEARSNYDELVNKEDVEQTTEIADTYISGFYEAEDCFDRTWILKPKVIITPQIVNEKISYGNSGDDYIIYSLYFQISQDCIDAFNEYRNYLNAIVDQVDYSTWNSYRAIKDNKAVIMHDYCYDTVDSFLRIEIMDNEDTVSDDSNTFLGHICENCSEQATHTIIISPTWEMRYYCDKHYKEMEEMLASSSSGRNDSSTPKSNSSAGSTFTHTCEQCSKEGTHEIISPFSGEKEYYCDEHYKEMEEMLASMGFDVGSLTSKSSSGSGSTSSHICEVCSKKATHEITSPFSGQKEYYCDEHYKEMSEILGSMLLQ